MQTAAVDRDATDYVAFSSTSRSSGQAEVLPRVPAASPDSNDPPPGEEIIILRGTEPVAEYGPIASRRPNMCKAHRHRLDTAMLRVEEATVSAGFELAPLTAGHWRAAALRDWSHGDPFDRLLLARAETERMELGYSVGR